MIIKLTIPGRNEATFVNFDYVRTMRRDGAFTELVMSDDKYHKLAVLETPDEIYVMLYPPKSCAGNCSCHNEVVADTDSITVETETTSEASVVVKKPAAKKTTAKAAEQN